MLDFLFLVLAVCGGCAIGARVVRRQCDRATIATIDRITLEMYALATAAAHQAYIGGSLDQARGKFDPDGWVEKLHADGIEGFSELMEGQAR
jgi:hypothetical protein